MSKLAEEIHQWLEEFNLGYKRDDPSTIREECLPIIHQKGLVQAYGAPHEVSSPCLPLLPARLPGRSQR